MAPLQLPPICKHIRNAKKISCKLRSTYLHHPNALPIALAAAGPLWRFPRTRRNATNPVVQLWSHLPCSNAMLVEYATLKDSLHLLEFRRVTIWGAQPSARLSEEICLSEGSPGSLRGLCGVSPGALRGLSGGSAGFSEVFRG